jgi:hypothetical protein
MAAYEHCGAKRTSRPQAALFTIGDSTYVGSQSWVRYTYSNR